MVLALVGAALVACGSSVVAPVRAAPSPGLTAVGRLTWDIDALMRRTLASGRCASTTSRSGCLRSAAASARFRSSATCPTSTRSCTRPAPPFGSFTSRENRSPGSPTRPSGFATCTSRVLTGSTTTAIADGSCSAVVGRCLAPGFGVTDCSPPDLHRCAQGTFTNTGA